MLLEELVAIVIVYCVRMYIAYVIVYYVKRKYDVEKIEVKTLPYVTFKLQKA